MNERDFASRLKESGLDAIPRDDLVAARPAAERLALQAQLVRRAINEADADDDDDHD